MSSTNRLDQSRLLAIREDYDKMGEDETAKRHGISRSTLERYLRELKVRETQPKNNVRILIFDVETAPGEYLAWRTGKQYISQDNEIKRPFMLSWAAKWLFEPVIMGDVVTPTEALDCDDSRIARSIWALIDEADIIIAHNGDKFDIPWLNTVFILNGLDPPSSYQSIDTYGVVRKRKTGFYFASNRLDYLGKLVRNKGKMETNYGLWKGCKAGEQQSLNDMLMYNKEDVVLLEEVYVWMRPWIHSHPNIGLYVETSEPVCPNCGSERLNWGGFYDTPAGRYSTFRCECGAIGRSRYTALSLGKRKGLTVGTAR